METKTDKISLNKIIYLDNYKRPHEEIDEDAVLQQVKEAVETGNYIENEYSETGKHALMCACILKMEKIALYLIENKVVDLHAISKEGLNSLLFAINFKLYHAAEKLLEDASVEDLLQREVKNNLNAFAMTCTQKNQEFAVDIFNKMAKTIKGWEKLREAFSTPIYGNSLTILILICRSRLYYVAKVVINFQYTVNKTMKERGDTTNNYDFLNINFEDAHGYDGRFYFLEEIGENLRNKLCIEKASPDKLEETTLVFDKLFLYFLKLYEDKPNKIYKIQLPTGERFNSSVITMCILNGLPFSLNYALQYAEKSDIQMKTVYEKDAMLMLTEKFDEDWRTYNIVLMMFNVFAPKFDMVDFKAIDSDGNTVIGLCFYGGYFEFALHLIKGKYVKPKTIMENKIDGKNMLFIGCNQLVKKYYVNRYNLDQPLFNKEFKCILDIINIILRRNPDVGKELLTHVESDGTSLLHCCAGIHGSLPIIKMILKKMSDPNKINVSIGNGQTPLAIACVTNNIPVAKHLLGLPGIQYNTTHPGVAPILLVCEYKTEDIALELLKFTDIDLDVRNLNSMSPFVLACLHGLSNVAMKMLTEFPATTLKYNFYSITPYQLASMCGLVAVKEKMETMGLDKEIMGNSYTYGPDDIVYDVYTLENKTVQEYLDEEPDNVCFILKSGNKKLYGLTKIDKIREAVNAENIYNNDVFYGCKDVMETYLQDYLWSADPDMQEIAIKNVDTRFLLTYLQKFAVLNAFVYNPALEGLVSYPSITHRCYFLEVNANFKYKSVINKHLIDSTATDSTGTTHCGSIAEPIVYNLVPCFPVVGETRKRRRSPASQSPAKKTKKNVPKGPYISVNYRENVYFVEYEKTTTVKQLRDMFLDQLVEQGIITKPDNMDDVIVMFVFLGRVYRTKGEEGDTILVKRDIVDKYPEHKEIVLVSNVRLPPSGGVTGGIRKTRKRTNNKKKTRRTLLSGCYF